MLTCLQQHVFTNTQIIPMTMANIKILYTRGSIVDNDPRLSHDDAKLATEVVTDKAAGVADDVIV